MKGAAWTFADVAPAGRAERASGLAGRVARPLRAYDAPGGRAASGGSRAGRRLDRGPRPAGPAAGVVPGLVAAHASGRARMP